jgi:hypothetical protein
MDAAWLRLHATESGRSSSWPSSARGTWTPASATCSPVRPGRAVQEPQEDNYLTRGRWAAEGPFKRRRESPSGGDEAGWELVKNGDAAATVSRRLHKPWLRQRDVVVEAVGQWLRQEIEARLLGGNACRRRRVLQLDPHPDPNQILAPPPFLWNKPTTPTRSPPSGPRPRPLSRACA